MAADSDLQSSVQRRRILFDASVLANGPMDGIRRYTLEILSAVAPVIEKNHPDLELYASVDGVSNWPIEKVLALIETDSLHQIDRYARHPNPNAWTELSRFAGRMQRSIVKRLPIRRDKFDLLHLPLPNSYSTYRQHTAPLVMTVHDLCHVVCPEFQVATNIETLKDGIEHALRRDAKFIAVSNSTARELRDIENVDDAKIFPVHSACDRSLFRPVNDPATVQQVYQKYGIPDAPYLFSLCTLEPRKNLMSLVRAFRMLSEAEPDNDCHLVLAGRAGWGDQEEILKAAASDRVHLIGRVEDEDLPVLYSQAMAFACFSYYEGFCLPLLEAMTCGCPVLHANLSAMPEVAGGAGLQAAPDDLSTIQHLLSKVSNDGALRQHMKQKSLERANDFSWQSAAEQVVATYEQCLAENCSEAVYRKAAA